MADQKKAEVNLEISSGVFRIPTDDVVYNITVIGQNESSTTRVIEKIVEVEKPPAAPSSLEINDEPNALHEILYTSTPEPEIVPAQPVITDDYYKLTALKLNTQLTKLVAGHSPDSEGSQNLEGLANITEMTDNLKEVATNLKELLQDETSAPKEPVSNTVPAELDSLTELIAKAIELASIQPAAPDTSAPDATPAPAQEPAPAQSVTRYLFNMDAVFQTMYELCTNETVKTHIQNTRKKITEIFDINAFYDDMSPKVSGYDEDDGFINVPMSDIYSTLSSHCKEKNIINLLSKMDKQQSEIFLDQFLPLESPPTEEVTVESQEPTPEPDPEPAATTDPPAEEVSNSELQTILTECQAQIASLSSLAADQPESDDTSKDLSDLAAKADEIITIASNVSHDAKQLATESNSDNDQAGGTMLWQQISQETALINSLISQKEENLDLTFEQGLAEANSLNEQTAIFTEDTAPPEELPTLETLEEEAPGQEVVEEIESAPEDDLQTEEAPAQEDAEEIESAPEDDLQTEEPPAQEVAEDTEPTPEDDLLTEEPAVQEADDEIESAPEDPQPKVIHDNSSDDPDDFGDASQDDIDKMLEDLG